MRKSMLCILLLLCLLLCCACGNTSPAESAPAAAPAAAPEASAPEAEAAEEPVEEPAEPVAAGMTGEQLLAYLPGEWCYVSTVLQPQSGELVNSTVVFSEGGTADWNVSLGDYYNDTVAMTWELRADLTVSTDINQSFRFSLLCGYPVMTLTEESNALHPTFMKAEDLEDFISTKLTKVTVTDDNISEYISGPIAIGPCYSIFGEAAYCFGVSSPVYASGMVYLGREGDYWRQSNYGCTRVYATGYGADALPCADPIETHDQAKYSHLEEVNGQYETVDEVVYYFIDASYIESVEFVTEKSSSYVAINNAEPEEIETNSVFRRITFVDGGELWYNYFEYCNAYEGADTLDTLDFSACLF